MDNEDDTVTLETIIIQTQQSKGEEEEEDQVLQELDETSLRQITQSNLKTKSHHSLCRPLPLTNLLSPTEAKT